MVEDVESVDEENRNEIFQMKFQSLGKHKEEVNIESIPCIT
jgi:hypothetical protein